jgi:heme exporter protein A
MNSATEGLVVDKVHVWRGERHVLKGMSLSLNAGELLHVSGPNGTGKTTLLRVITGLLRPEQGLVSWRGTPILSSRQQFQVDLAYAAHEQALKADFTALENLRYSVGLKRNVARPELMAALEQTGVGRCADLPARVLSAGQRRRVTMARILAMRAPLWLLDEPFANLDAEGSVLVAELLQTHVRGGGLALVVAHHELTVDCTLRRLELNS